MRIVFDTNALLMPFEFGTNPYEGASQAVPGAELITLEKCINELKGLQPLNWESILTLGLKNGLKIIKSSINGLSVDNTIVEFAKREKAIVLTQDKLLKKKLLNNSLRVLIMRQKKYFEVIG